MADGFADIIYGPTLPRSLNQLRNLVTSALTTSRSEASTADAIGFYCTVTELRVLVATLLKATPDEFVGTDHRDAAEAFRILDRSAGLFTMALYDLERAGVSQQITGMLTRYFDAESPLHGLAAASIAVFLGVRLAAE
jgi:hypothetical protein